MPGRTSDYTPEIAREICERLASGESMVEICEAEHMPHRVTVGRWMNELPLFAADIARAREDQAEYMDHKVLETANHCGEHNYNSAKVKIAAYQWRAAKLKPKVYSDKVQQELSSPDGSAPTLNVVIRSVLDPK